METAVGATDIELLEKIAHADHHAFAILFKRHYSGVFNFLLSMVKIPAMAEDLLQDVFMKVWENAAQIQVKASFSSYLYQISRNKAIDALRRIGNDPSLKDEVIHRISSGLNRFAQDDLDWREYENLFNRAALSLPPQRKTAFFLVRIEGKKYDEAAAIMGVTRNTLKQHLSLAVEDIRRYLSEHGDIIFVLFFAYLIF